MKSIKQNKGEVGELIGKKKYFDEVPEPLTTKVSYFTPQQLKEAIQKIGAEKRKRTGKRTIDFKDIGDIIWFNASEAVNHRDLNTFVKYTIIINNLWNVKRRVRNILISDILPELANRDIYTKDIKRSPDTNDINTLLEIIKNMKDIRITDRIDSFVNVLILTRKTIDEPLSGQREEFKSKILETIKDLILDILEYPGEDMYTYLTALESLDVRVLVNSNVEFFKELLDKYDKNNELEMIKRQALYSFIIGDIEDFQTSQNSRYIDCSPEDLECSAILDDELDQLHGLDEPDKLNLLSILNSYEISRLRKISEASDSQIDEDEEE